MSHYILDKNGEPVVEADTQVWAKWFEESSRVVDAYEKGNVLVSTVFLGMDHGFYSHDPILFETMLFSPDFPEVQFRYTTRAKALAKHDKVVAEVKKVSKAGKPFQIRGIQDWKEFNEWASDHLKHHPVVSEMFELIGFKSEMDAFVFKSSRWCNEI